MAKKIRTTLEPKKVIEVSDLEAEQLAAMGLVKNVARPSTPVTETAPAADDKKESRRG